FDGDFVASPTLPSPTWGEASLSLIFAGTILRRLHAFAVRTSITKTPYIYLYSLSTNVEQARREGTPTTNWMPTRVFDAYEINF
ncbi:MAG TPA: hypothetical protein VK968_10580, partial [Roseimicrobium sp.]|nr:hypothetical protein [Roseimicrobium sp.]